MAKKDQIFLVSGQYVEMVDGAKRLSADIKQCVVVAPGAADVYATLTELKPDFHPIGLASLEEYETAIAQLRATISGKDTGWPLLVAAGMVG